MKKSVKIIIAIVVIIALILGIYGVMFSLRKKEALETVDHLFTAIASGNKDEINNYMNYDELMENVNNEEEASTEEDEATTQVVNQLFQDVSYEVISSDIKFNHATIKVNVSNKNVGVIFQNYFAKAVELAFSGAFGGNTETEMNNELMTYLQQQVESDEIEKLTNEVTLDMERKDGTWKVDCDKEEFVNAVLPGMKSFIDSMNMGTEE